MSHSLATGSRCCRNTTLWMELSLTQFMSITELTNAQVTTSSGPSLLSTANCVWCGAGSGYEPGTVPMHPVMLNAGNVPAAAPVVEVTGAVIPDREACEEARGWRRAQSRVAAQQDAASDEMAAWSRGDGGRQPEVNCVHHLKRKRVPLLTENGERQWLYNGCCSSKNACGKLEPGGRSTEGQVGIRLGDPAHCFA